MKMLICVVVSVVLCSDLVEGNAVGNSNIIRDLDVLRELAENRPANRDVIEKILKIIDMKAVEDAIPVENDPANFQIAAYSSDNTDGSGADETGINCATRSRIDQITSWLSRTAGKAEENVLMNLEDMCQQLNVISVEEEISEELAPPAVYEMEQEPGDKDCPFTQILNSVDQLEQTIKEIVQNMLRIEGLVTAVEMSLPTTNDMPEESLESQQFTSSSALPENEQSESKRQMETGLLENEFYDIHNKARTGGKYGRLRTDKTRIT